MLGGDELPPYTRDTAVRLLPREEEFFDLFVAVATGVGRLKKGDEVMRFCIDAKKLEEEGDALYHEALGRMFEPERDALEVIKWKETYDNLERTLDESEDVANDLESITLKHA